MRHINDLIVDAVVDDLTDEFSSVDESESVGIVRGGRLQDDPGKYRIYVLVHVQDPENDQWEDILVAKRDQAVDRGEVVVPAFEIGGGSMTWRRFTVEFGYYGIKTKEDRDEARQIAQITMGRIERAIRRSQRINGKTDDLDEYSVMTLVVQSRIDEGGGPPKSFIWRGRVHFQVLTNRPY